MSTKYYQGILFVCKMLTENYMIIFCHVFVKGTWSHDLILYSIFHGGKGKMTPSFHNDIYSS